MFVRLLGLKKWGSVLRNKDNLHLISLGCSAGNNGRCSSVALNRCVVWAEWPSLFRAGAAGALQIGTKALCRTAWPQVCGGGERNWMLVKLTPSLLLSQGRCSAPPQGTPGTHWGCEKHVPSGWQLAATEHVAVATSSIIFPTVPDLLAHCSSSTSGTRTKAVEVQLRPPPGSR